MPEKKPKIRITRKERKTGMIDASKIPQVKTKVVAMHREKPMSEVHLGHEVGKTKKTYTPADIRTGDERYGKESASKATPDFVKKAQGAKQDIVHHKDKPYRAGHTTETSTPAKVKIKVRSTPSIHMHKTVPDNSKTAAEIRAKGGNAGKRKLPHVDYLEKLKRNKRTEAGN
jgi:hypothetical protein